MTVAAAAAWTALLLLTAQAQLSAQGTVMVIGLCDHNNIAVYDASTAAVVR